MGKKVSTKLNIPMEDQYVSLTNTSVSFPKDGSSPVHRYDCMGCNKTESMAGGRQAEHSIARRAQSHRCEAFLNGDEDYLDRKRKDLD